MSADLKMSYSFSDDKELKLYVQVSDIIPHHHDTPMAT